MFQIGDYVRMKNFCYDRDWYSDETYQILDFNIMDKDIVKVDRIIKSKNLPDSGVYGDEINIEYIELDIVYYRNEKIKKLKERICSR